jgi:hypothetical protein
MNTPIRSRHFKRFLGPEFTGRVVHGSDLPIAISPLWVRLRGLISHEAYKKCRAEKNLLQRDVLIKQALGFPEDTFTRLGDLLRKPKRAEATAVV